MKKNKKSEIQPDVLIYITDDLKLFRTPNNQYYIVDDKQTFKSELYNNLEQAVSSAIEMRKKIY